MAPRLLEHALHRLVAQLPDLDAELQLRLAAWLAVAGQRVALSVPRGRSGRQRCVWAIVIAI